MKRTLKIGAGFEAVIPTGSYQNQRPSFYIEETFETETMTDEELFQRQKTLQEKIYDNFKQAEQKAIVERIEKERSDFRFYTSPSGKSLPSVTSIINYDADFFISPEELRQYSSIGNIIHGQVYEFIKTGKWKEPKEIESLWTDILIVKKGSLQLDWDSVSFTGFLEKYPIANKKNAEAIFNDVDEYAGTPDFYGVPQFKEAKEIYTVFDVKRTPDRHKNFMQMAAYAKPNNIKQMVIVPLSDKTQQGFSKPIVSEDVEGFYQMFLQKRKEFKKRYGA